MYGSSLEFGVHGILPICFDGLLIDLVGNLVNLCNVWISVNQRVAFLLQDLVSWLWSFDAIVFAST
jgi:hypothetical protein